MMNFLSYKLKYAPSEFGALLTFALAGMGGSMRPPAFLRCTPNYESDRAEILHGLWGILCATFGKKIDRVLLGHGAMTSQEVQGQVIFARNGGLLHIRRRYRPRRGFFWLF